MTKEISPEQRAQDQGRLSALKKAQEAEDATLAMSGEPRAEWVTSSKKFQDLLERIGMSYTDPTQK